MAKGYEDLSRRGLIQLNKDFDQDHDGELLHYLSENSDKYEGIRPIEAIIDRADQASEIIGDTGRKIKTIVADEGGKLLEGVIDAISDIADMITPEAEDLIESLIE